MEDKEYQKVGKNNRGAYYVWARYSGYLMDGYRQLISISAEVKSWIASF
ncbi:MAG TPA: hypothetical protein VGA79_12195 [Desulfobaccales bacterium]